jgi:hypothetical protein
MTIEFIGMIGTQEVSEIHPAAGPVVDRETVRRGRAPRSAPTPVRTVRDHLEERSVLELATTRGGHHG